jgi:hypothetical protein
MQLICSIANFPKFVLVFLALSLNASAIDGLPGDYTPIDSGHVDISFCFEDGLWDLGLAHEVGGNPGEPADGSLRAGELAPMIAKDLLFPTGSRQVRPVDPVWSFLGVAAGSPYWFFPETSSTLVYPGFNVCDIQEAVSYLETDPRVNSTGEWVTVALQAVDYKGKSAVPGKFSLWTTNGLGQVTVWMNQANGIDATDKYIILNNSHAHPNMGFSALGLYAVNFNLTFYEGPGKTNPVTSPTAAYYFAIGTYWEWVARYIAPTDWFVSNTVAENDDPDHDGLVNVVEYAFGLDPTVPDAAKYNAALGKGLPTYHLEAAGTSLAMKFPRRRAETNSQIVTSFQSSSGGAWASSTGTTSTTVVNGTWENVTHSVPVSGSQQFLRVKVELQPEIPY